MRFLFLSIFCLLIHSKVFSEEIHAELSFISPPTIFKEGDVIEGVLKVWPLENADLNEFKKLDGVTLAEAFYVSEIESSEVSANNADVIEAKLLFIVKRSKDKSFQMLDYKGHLINIQIPVFTLAPAEKDPEGYFVLEQRMLRSNLVIVVCLIIFAILITALVVKKQSIKEFFKKIKIDPEKLQKKNFNQLFSSARKREDYESIYAQRNIWIGLVKVMAPVYLEFFKIMELHQYKKEWNEEDLREIERCFDIIRGSFK